MESVAPARIRRLTVDLWMGGLGWVLQVEPYWLIGALAAGLTRPRKRANERHFDAPLTATEEWVQSVQCSDVVELLEGLT